MAPSLLLLSALLASTPSLPADAPVLQPPETNLVRARAKWVALGGSALFTAGATLWILGAVQHANASAGTSDPGQLASAQENALHNTLGGMGLAIVGACFLWASAEMWQWHDSAPTVSASLSPHGGALVLSGPLP